MNLEKWKDAADVEISKIINKEPTENDVPYLAALLLISQQNQSRHPIMHHSPNSSTIDDLMCHEMQSLKNYVKEKSLAQTTGIDLHHEYAKKELGAMLDTHLDLMERIYNSADDDEAVLVNQYYENLSRIIQ